MAPQGGGGGAKQGARKVAWVLVDGLGDVGSPELGGRTPLQAARVPALDALAAAGLSGLMDPVAPGVACGSDTAHLSLLGYEPRGLYRGRGAFESLGAGLRVDAGDIGFKCNFATLCEASGVVVARRADRHFEAEGPVLCRALDGLRLPGFPELEVRVRYATEHRCGVVVSGPGLSDQISGTDPLRDGLPLLHPHALDPADADAVHTARVVEALSEEMTKVLKEHPVNADRARAGKPPANVVLLRGCGGRLKVPPFSERHGLRACMVAPTKIIAGVGMTLGIDVLSCPGATGDYHSDLSAKARVIAAALAESGSDGSYDLGFLHVKAIDDAGHDGNLALKIRLLEAVDTMVLQLVKRLWRQQREQGGTEYVLCLTGDHSTPAGFGDHSHEPVPFAVAHLADMAAALGGEAVLNSVSLETVPMPATDVPLPCLVGASSKVSAELPPAGAMAGDSVRTFDEVAAADGALGRFLGAGIMPFLKSLIRPAR